MYASGSTIDSWMKSSSGWPAVFAKSGSLSRSGPTVPFEPAGVNVWQLPQPLASKTALPAAASPFTSAGGAGVLPTTLVGVGVVTVPGPHPAATTSSTAIGASRRTRASLYRPKSGSPGRRARRAPGGGMRGTGRYDCPMKRATYGRNTGLTLRMLLTGSLLGLLYVVFA